MCSAIPYQAKSTQDIRRAFRRRFLSQKSPEHYRTHIVFVKKKRAKRLADTVFFKHKYITQPMVTPADRFKDVTYITFVCSIRTEKKDLYQTRATMVDNLINYPDDVGTPTANLLLIKIFLNSVILTPEARFANANISNFYLITWLKQPDYAKIKLSDISEEVIKEYKLHEMTMSDGWGYIKAIRGMYGIYLNWDR
jgi:hypothetical protein